MRKPASSYFAAIVLPAGLAGILAGATAAQPAFQSDSAGGETAPSAAEEELQNLAEEYESEAREFQRAYRKKSEEEKGAFYAEHAPDPEAYVPRFRALAEGNPGTEVAVGAFAWIVRNSEDDASIDGALDALARDYLGFEAVADVCGLLVYRFADTSFLDTALQHGTHASVQGAACFNLAQLHLNAADLKRRVADEELSREQIVSALGEEAMAWIEGAETAELQKAADGYLARVVEEFAEVPGRRKTLGESAEGMLFKLRNLAIGKVAPDIEGEDVRGRSLPAERLSREGRRARLLGEIGDPPAGPCTRTSGRS